MSQQTEKPQGRLYAIGTGPGASDLITVRGARIISELDILYAPAGKKDAPSLAHTIVAPYITGKTTVKTYHFLMKAPQEAKEAVWDDVAKAIQEDVADGKKSALSPWAIPCCSVPGFPCWSVSAISHGWK